MQKTLRSGSCVECPLRMQGQRQQQHPLPPGEENNKQTQRTQANGGELQRMHFHSSKVLITYILDKSILNFDYRHTASTFITCTHQAFYAASVIISTLCMNFFFHFRLNEQSTSSPSVIVVAAVCNRSILYLSHHSLV